MKKLMMLSAATMIALGAWAASAAPNFPLGTHIMRGSLKGYDEDGRNVILSSSRNMTIRAVNTNGQVIAESKVKDPTAEGLNFALLVPLSTTATDSTCVVGDKLNCVIVEQSGLSISTSPVTVGGAREAQVLSLRLENVKRYVSADGSKTNEISQAYVDAIQAWMSDEEDFRGRAYDPFADYDRDGRSNYAEYLAGTNPFDPSDKLAITGFSMANGAAAISFEYVGGHLYGVAATPSLVNPKWMESKVRTSPEGDELSQVVPSPDSSDLGETTIYVTPAKDAPTGFFTLEPR